MDSSSVVECGEWCVNLGPQTGVSGARQDHSYRRTEAAHDRMHPFSGVVHDRMHPFPLAAPTEPVPQGRSLRTLTSSDCRTGVDLSLEMSNRKVHRTAKFELRSVCYRFEEDFWSDWEPRVYLSTVDAVVPELVLSPMEAIELAKLLVDHALAQQTHMTDRFWEILGSHDGTTSASGT